MDVAKAGGGRGFPPPMHVCDPDQSAGLLSFPSLLFIISYLLPADKCGFVWVFSVSGNLSLTACYPSFSQIICTIILVGKWVNLENPKIGSIIRYWWEKGLNSFKLKNSPLRGWADLRKKPKKCQKCQNGGPRNRS